MDKIIPFCHFSPLCGIVVGIVALPLAIAFAAASGVSPEKGLITAILGGYIISFLGGSRVRTGGPTGAFIVIIHRIFLLMIVGSLAIFLIFRVKIVHLQNQNPLEHV